VRSGVRADAEGPGSFLSAELSGAGRAARAGAGSLRGRAGRGVSPQSLPRACMVAGCPARAEAHGRCQAHQVPAEYADHQAIYDTAKHRQWRRRVLSANPICPGWPAGVHGARAVEAKVADHIVPLADGGGWQLSNGRGLCAACHSRRHAAEKRRGTPYIQSNPAPSPSSSYRVVRALPLAPGLGWGGGRPNG
jgi:hypothetical protein